jgi:putative thiamine transport system substrate-binding protein
MINIRTARNAKRRELPAKISACTTPFLCLGWLLLLASIPALAQVTPAWAAAEIAAKGQTVVFVVTADLNADGYLAWLARETKSRFGINLMVRKRATPSATTGRADLVQVSSEELGELLAGGLLREGWAASLPNRTVLPEGPYTENAIAAVVSRSSGVPWGRKQLTFLYDAWGVIEPPADPAALLDWIRDHPRRFTYPRPPDTSGTAFLEWLLMRLAAEPARLERPADGDFAAVSAPLWRWLDAAHPLMWRSGWAFPENAIVQLRLLDAGTVDWTLTLDPAEGQRAMATGDLPNSIRSLQFAGGVFRQQLVVIPLNAASAAAAGVVANFLLSPEAQARKADVALWGNSPDIDPEKLPPSERHRLTASTAELVQTIGTAPSQQAPHASWKSEIAREWKQRYAQEQ